MHDDLTYREKIDAAAVAGEMAASRLHGLLVERFEELQAQGVTQADVARNLGATPQQVGKWLIEPRNMTIRSIGRLLSAMRAHLLLDTERYEDIQGGNAAPAPPAVNMIFQQPQHSFYLEKPQGQIIEPPKLNSEKVL
jgi:transcriptional regulator with XRE-family HTH domain